MSTNTIPSRAGKYNIVINRHASFRFQWRWRTGGDAPANISLVGARSLMQVRAHEQVDSPLFEASSWDGKIALGGDTGLLTMLLTPAQTSAMQFDEGFYDWLITLSDGMTHRVLEGKFFVLGGITRMP